MMTRRAAIKTVALTVGALTWFPSIARTQPKPKGRWVSGGTLDVTGIHAAMLPNGLVMAFGYNHLHHFDDEEGGYQLWDPIARAPAGPKRSFTGFNPFCAGQCFLGDGRLFVAGGYKSGDPTVASAADQVRVVRTNGATADISLIQIARSLGANTVSGMAQRLGLKWPPAPAIRVRVLAGIASLAWERGGKMENIRWYPTVVTLANGDGFIIGGTAPFANDNWKDTNEDYEFFDLSQNRLITHSESGKSLPNDGDFDYPPGDERQKVADGKRLAGLYPLVHLLPNVPGDSFPKGLLFVLTESFVRIYDPALNRIIRTKQDAGGFRTWWTQASSVLLPIDIDSSGNGPSQVRIMIFGGGSLGKGNMQIGTNYVNDEGESAPALDTADIWVYDINAHAIAFEQSIKLNRPRFMGDSLLLPDGNIVLVGGASKGYTNINSARVLTAELVAPPTASSPGLVIDLGSASSPRGYHSSALLLPDGSVFVTGGTGGYKNSKPDNEFKTVEVFEPPYFSAGPRPQIVKAATLLRIGETIKVTSDRADIMDQIVLIRCGARTHSLDTDQRMLRLEASRQVNSDGTVTLTGHVPNNATFAPPGPYLLWVLGAGSAGAIPSVAKFVSVQLA